MSVVDVILERSSFTCADLASESIPDGERKCFQYQVQKVSDAYIAELDAMIEPLEPQILSI